MPTIEALLAAGAAVRAYDPQAERAARAIFGERITYAARSYDALEGADALAIVTEWNEFREPRLRAHAFAHASAGDLRRPQRVRRRADADRKDSPTTR